MAEYSDDPEDDDSGENSRDTSVRMPGGKKCEGGVCKKVKRFLNAKVPTKKRYNIKSTPNPPAKKTDDVVIHKGPMPSF